MWGSLRRQLKGKLLSCLAFGSSAEQQYKGKRKRNSRKEIKKESIIGQEINTNAVHPVH